MLTPCVGDIVTLIMDIMPLNLHIGDRGVCYHVYNIDHAQYIFQNGEYDGFSPFEAEEYLKFLGHSLSHEDYQFTNVIQLERDFRSGYFSEAKKTRTPRKTLHLRGD